MFEMLDIRKRSTIVFALSVYERWLRMQPGKLVTVANVPKIDRSAEVLNAQAMVKYFTNSFVYVADEIYDREKMYLEGVEKQPAFIALVAELATLVNKAVITDNHVDDAEPHMSTIDVDGTRRMREIVNVLNAGEDTIQVEHDQNEVVDKYAAGDAVDLTAPPTEGKE